MSRRRTSNLRRELAGIGAAAPEVIGRRSLKLMTSAAQGRQADTAEWQRMHVEKAQATLEGQRAMWWQAIRVQQQWATVLWGACLQPWLLPRSIDGLLRDIPAQAQAVLACGVAPGRRTVQANRRRLRRG